MAVVIPCHRTWSTTPCVGTVSSDQAGAAVSLHQPQPLCPLQPGALMCPPALVAAIPTARTSCGCVGWSAMGCLRWPTSAQMCQAAGDGQGCGGLHRYHPDSANVQALSTRREVQSSLASRGQFLLLMKQRWTVNDCSWGLDFGGLCYLGACNPISQAWLPSSRSDSAPVPER